MREQSRLLFWKVVACSALGGCALLFFRPTSVGARQAQGGALCERPSFTLGLFGGGSAQDSASSPGSTADVQELIATIERSSGQVRCAALARLAHHVELDENAVAVIASYTDQRHNIDIRACAASALGDAQHPSSAAWLIKLAEDPNLADAALRGLAQQDNPAALRALLDFAAQGPRYRRLVAITALANAGRAEATPLITSMLVDAPMGERYALITALGVTHDPNALGILRDMVSHATRNDQFAAINALGEFGGEAAARTLLELLPEKPGLAGSIVGALARNNSPEARLRLLSIAQDEQNPMFADAALGALAAQSGDDIGPVMQHALSSKSFQRVNVAIEYFAQHPSDEAMSELAALASDAAPRHAYSAISALQRIGGEEARAVLSDVAAAGGQTSGQAIAALAQIPEGAEEAYDLAIEAVRKGGPHAMSVISVLSQDERPEARRALIEVAQRGDQTSLSAIAQLGQRSDPESQRALEQLVSSAQTPELRSNALSAITQNGNPNSARLVESAVQTSRGAMRAQAAYALVELGGPNAERTLLEATRDESDPEFISGVSSALAQMGTPAALTRLEQLAGRADPQSSIGALGALAGVSPARAAPIAEALSKATDPGVRMNALAQVGMLPSDIGGRIVLNGIGDQDQMVVRQALEQVQWVGVEPVAGRAALLNLTKTPELPEDMRARALELLSSLGPADDES